MRRESGLSLVEVLIAIGLFGLVLTLLSQVLVPGLRIWRQTQAVSELEQNASLCQLRLRSALLASVSDSIRTVDKPTLQAASFLAHEGSVSQVGYDSVSGRANWQSMTVLKFVPGSGVLTQIRRVQPPLPTTKVFAFTTTQLQNACSSGLKERKVGEKVKSFRLTPETDKRQWTFELTFETNTPRGLHTVKRNFSVVPRIQGDPK